MTMSRRNLLGSLAVFFGTLPFGKVMGKKKYEVQTLEHEGWGFSRFPNKNLPYVRDAKEGESRYITRWTFDSKSKAEDFVRSLQPEITRMFLGKEKVVSSIRSGYRGTVRVQANDVRRLECMIVSNRGEDSVTHVHLQRPPFTDIEEAWGYLSNIRVNGEVVSGPMLSQVVWKDGSTHRLSRFLIRPFRKGNPEIVDVNDETL